MQYWSGSSSLVCGHPTRFWKRTNRWYHPFRNHALLARHGGTLSAAAKARAIERCKAKGITRIPLMFSFQLIYLLNRVGCAEINHQPALIALAKRTTHMVWGISEDQLEAHLTRRVAFGDLGLPRSVRGAILRASAVGYGGVLRDGDPHDGDLHDGDRHDGKLKVVARAWFWPLLSHELVKGTAELICLHGMNELDEDVYRKVVRAADRIEHEPWMLQSGAELWRRLLLLLPDRATHAQMLMHIARLPARSLEPLMLAVVEDPSWAQELLAGLVPEERSADDF
jgi:hypothetical protein